MTITDEDKAREQRTADTLTIAADVLRSEARWHYELHHSGQLGPGHDAIAEQLLEHEGDLRIRAKYHRDRAQGTAGPRKPGAGL